MLVPQTHGGIVVCRGVLADHSTKAVLKAGGQLLTTGSTQTSNLLFHAAIGTNPEADGLQGHGQA